MRPVKPVTMSVPKRCALSMQRFPGRERLAIDVAALQRIAEHAERADDDVGIADRLADLAGEPRDVLAAERLPEERLDALEAERQDLP